MNYNQPLFCLCACSLGLYVFRILMTGSLMYGFLLWNLILALIPFYIARALRKDSKLGAAALFQLMIWLAFLPNCPYIMTDFVHLYNPQHFIIYFDALLIGTFAVAGLSSFSSSCILVTDWVLNRNQRQWQNWIEPIMAGISCSAATGIYLGRVKRWNSWDLIYDAPVILDDITTILLHPFSHLATVTFIFSLAFLLYVTLIFQYRICHARL